MRRRALLSSLGTGGLVALAGCVGSAEGPFEPWEPDPGSWPLAQYDYQNTAHNPHASPPTDGVSVRWNESLATTILGLLGAEEALVAFGGGGIVATGYDGKEWWRAEKDIRAAGLYDGTIYAIELREEDDGVTARLLTFSLADGEERVLSTGFGGEVPYDLLVTDRYVFVGNGPRERRTVVVERDTGDDVWDIDDAGTLGLTPDGELVAGHAGHLAMYGAESGILSDDLTTEWGVRTYHGARMRHPTYTPYGILVGERQPSSPQYDRASVHAYRRDDGQVAWTSEPLGSGVSSPAVVDDVAYAAHGWLSQFRADEEEGADIVALDLREGGNLWRTTVDTNLSGVIAAENLVVVTGNRYVAGIDLDGEIQWTFHPPNSGPVIMVEDKLYVGTWDGDLIALEAE